MKKILTSLALLGAFAFGANAQILADIDVVVVTPGGSTSSPFIVPCNDSFDYEIILVNNGPGTIGATDTVYFYSPWSQDGYINLTYHENAAVPAGDTIAHYRAKAHRNGLSRLWDLTGQPVFPPFENDDYGFFVLARGFSADTSIIKDPVDDNNENGGIVRIDCATSIKDANFSKSTLSIYPNPASSVISFETGVINGEATVRITDLTGRTVMVKDLGKQVEGTKTFTVDVATLTRGMYFVEFVNGTNKAISKVTIK